MIQQFTVQFPIPVHTLDQSQKVAKKEAVGSRRARAGGSRRAIAIARARAEAGRARAGRARAGRARAGRAEAGGIK